MRTTIPGKPRKSANGAARAFGRSLKDFLPATHDKPFYGLYPAEKKLLDAAKRGVMCDLLGKEDAPDRDVERWKRINEALERLKQTEFFDLAIDFIKAHEPRTANADRATHFASAARIDLYNRVAKEPALLWAFFWELTEDAHDQTNLPVEWRSELVKLFDARSGLFHLEIQGWRSVDCNDAAIRIRGPFIRFLALGGDSANPVHDEGVWLHGGLIVGCIDLYSAANIGPITLSGCAIVERIVLGNARINLLDLSGTHIPGIEAEEAKCSGSMLLKDGFRSTGDIRLASSEIGGRFSCRNGSIFGTDGSALNCDGAEIKGNVLLDGGFNAKGEIGFLNADISGDFTCRNGRFLNRRGIALACDGATIKGDVFLSEYFLALGEVCLMGAEISGVLTCEGGTFCNAANDHSSTAIQLQDAKITKAVLLKDARILGHLECTAAHCGTLIDTISSWGAASAINAGGVAQSCHLVLDGFTYERFDGETVQGPEQRLAWLRRQKPAHLHAEFRPQPFEQLIKVYRQMGHEYWARHIAKSKQHHQRFADMGRYLGTEIPAWKWRDVSFGQKISAPTKGCWGILIRGLRNFFNGLAQKGHRLKTLFNALILPLVAAFFLLEWFFIGVVAGFGYGKKRLIFALVGAWLLGAWFFQQAADQNLMGPVNPVIYLNPILSKECKTQWMECAANGKLPRELRDFSPHLYSADVLLPFVTFGQDDTWRPISAFETENRIVHGQMLNLPTSQMLLHLPYGHEVDLPFWAPRAALWIQIVTGWALSLLAVGVFSGIVKKD